MAVRMGTESPDGVQLWPELDPAGPPRRLRSGRIDDILTCPVPGTSFYGDPAQAVAVAPRRFRPEEVLAWRQDWGPLSPPLEP